MNKIETDREQDQYNWSQVLVIDRFKHKLAPSGADLPAFGPNYALLAAENSSLALTSLYEDIVLLTKISLIERPNASCCAYC